MQFVQTGGETRTLHNDKRRGKALIQLRSCVADRGKEQEAKNKLPRCRSQKVCCCCCCRGVTHCIVLYRRDCGGEIKQNMPWATYATIWKGVGNADRGGERSRKREMDVQRVVVKGGGTRKETLALLTVELARETTSSVGLLSSIHPKRTGIFKSPCIVVRHSPRLDPVVRHAYRIRTFCVFLIYRSLFPS